MSNIKTILGTSTDPAPDRDDVGDKLLETEQSAASAEVKADYSQGEIDLAKGSSNTLLEALNLKIDTADRGAASGVAPLDSTSRVPVANLPEDFTTGLTLIGSWDADTNSPALPDASTNEGDFYIVSVAGETNIDGLTGHLVGDRLISNGTVYIRDRAGSGSLVAANDLSDVADAATARGNLSVNSSAETAAAIGQSRSHYGTIKKTANSPDVSPADGDAYILESSPSGAFASGSEHDIAVLSGSNWYIRTPKEGERVYDDEDGYTKQFSSTYGWCGVESLPTHTALKAALPEGEVIREGIKGGAYEWTAGDYSAEVAADTLNIEWSPSDHVATTVGAWRRKHKNVMHVQWAGVLPQLGDVAATLQTFYRYCRDNGYTAKGHGRLNTYICNSQVNLSDTPGRVDWEVGTMGFDFTGFQGTSTVVGSEIPAQGCFRFGLSEPPTANISDAIAQRGSSTMSMSSVSELSEGMEVLISDLDSTRRWDTSTTMFNEKAEIKEISGTTVTFKSPLKLPYPSGVSVYPLSKSVGYKVPGTYIKGGGPSAFQCGIIGAFCVDNDIDGVEIEDVYTYATMENMSVRTTGLLTVRGANRSGFGYARGQRGCFECVVSVISEDVRHGRSLGAGTGFFDNYDGAGYYNRVIDRDNYSPFVISKNCTDAIEDRHPGGFNNRAGYVGGTIQAGATGDAIAIQDGNGSIDRVDIEGAGRHGILLQFSGAADVWNNLNPTDTPTDYGKCIWSFKNMRILGTSSSDRPIVVDPLGAAPEEMVIFADFEEVRMPNPILTLPDVADIRLVTSGSIEVGLGSSGAFDLRSSTTARTIAEHSGDIIGAGTSNSTPLVYLRGNTYEDANTGEFGVKFQHRSGRAIAKGAGTAYIRANDAEAFIDVAVDRTGLTLIEEGIAEIKTGTVTDL